MTAPLTIILLLWCPHLIFSDERSAVSRAEFAHAMSAIKPGRLAITFTTSNILLVYAAVPYATC